MIKKLNIINSFKIKKMPEPNYFWVEDESGVTYICSQDGEGCEYSTDKVNWINTRYEDIYVEGKVYLRTKIGRFPRIYLYNNQSFSVGGDLATLIDYTEEPSEIYKSYNFNYIFDTNYFYGFEGLKDASKLDFSAVTHAKRGQFDSMFSYCRNMEIGPDFSNITSVEEGSFNGMFMFCNNLRYVKAPKVTEWNDMAFASWLYDVSPTGELVVSSELTNLPVGFSGIPEGWQRVNY